MEEREWCDRVREAMEREVAGDSFDGAPTRWLPVMQKKKTKQICYTTGFRRNNQKRERVKRLSEKVVEESSVMEQVDYDRDKKEERSWNMMSYILTNTYGLSGVNLLQASRCCFH
ncbi:hypothetical protein VIGAN_10211200 [Vigna angularis var. angularis]|uniref:Uncharacterized protein n=1 Tax=Vigna angularis var. angularis TaxID=157739 RepID=A0A0S3T5K6_PHAAN|nr:hypothetical protein VIGAN_10211200 [Vigna angularis var. angularis]